MSIDVHCHLTGGEYDRAGGLSAVLERARAAGVSTMICSGFDLESSLAAKELSEQNPDVYFSAGFQPEELSRMKEGDLSEITRLAAHPKCVAIGEIGLDYHFPTIPTANCKKKSLSDN